MASMAIKGASSQSQLSMPACCHCRPCVCVCVHPKDGVASQSTTNSAFRRLGSTTTYGARSLPATVTCKTPVPNPSHPVPQLRCPSDVQVLRAEASASSPDLLDIFIIVVSFVCFSFPFPLDIAVLFVPVDGASPISRIPSRAVS